MALIGRLEDTTSGRCIEFPAPWIGWIEEYATNGRIIAGAGKGAILGQFLTEAVVLTSLGGLVGLLTGPFVAEGPHPHLIFQDGGARCFSRAPPGAS